MDFSPRLVDPKDRPLIQLLVRVVRRIRVALGGIDEDAVLVSHADRLGLPPEQASDDGTRGGSDAGLRGNDARTAEEATWWAPQPSGHRRALNLLASPEDLNGSFGLFSGHIYRGFRPSSRATTARRSLIRHT
jgi:hypothetical protein